MAYTPLWYPQQQPQYPGISRMTGQEQAQQGPPPSAGVLPPSAATPITNANPPGFSGADGLAAFGAQQAQAQQASGQLRLQGQREFLGGRHLGIGGTDINPATGRETGNPFDTGFFNSSAAQLSPEARLASQGNNAMNQWGVAGGMSGVNPEELQRMNGVRAAHAIPHGVDAETFRTPEPPQPDLGSSVKNELGGYDLYNSGAFPKGSEHSLVGFSSTNGVPPPGTPLISDENGVQLTQHGPQQHFHPPHNFSPALGFKPSVPPPGYTPPNMAFQSQPQLPAMPGPYAPPQSLTVIPKPLLPTNTAQDTATMMHAKSLAMKVAQLGQAFGF